MQSKFKVVAVTFLLTFYFALCTSELAFFASFAQAPKSFTPYSEARPILEALRADLLPPELREPAARETRWPVWLARHDAATRARVDAGDEDSVVHLLLYGTAFTRQPPIGEQELAGIVVDGRDAAAPAFVPSPALKARLADFISAVASPGTNERLQFARQVLERRGLDPDAAEGRTRVQRYLEERTATVGRAERTARLLDASTALTDKLTLFRDRGLSSDTAIFIDYGVERALDAMKAAGVLRRETIRRVAVIGPGLDIVDKQNGYDFYPLQTLQPFALIDSLLRLELADSSALEVTAVDLSRRVLEHLDAARGRARTGTPYTVVLPRNTARPWTDEILEYWRRFGNWIGAPAARVPPVPPNAGGVEVRAVTIRPAVVSLVRPIDLNIVAERLVDDTFDLVLATNVLLYYDVFEQSLAAANIATMLRPGGFLLTNNRIFELPRQPLNGVGYTDVVYMTLPGIGDTGDRIIWYRKQ
ncbi:MAG: hypothetical protein HYY76_03205 [Acidobacteria bacterium]|nr:hypothetical protein [Acidobacteriota bacterium]